MPKPKKRVDVKKLVGRVTELMECAGLTSLDHLQHKYGAVVLFTIVVALVIGVYRFANA